MIIVRRELRHEAGGHCQRILCVVRDILVPQQRDGKVAKRFITDKLRRHDVAQRDLSPKVKLRQSRYLNNRAVNSLPRPRQSTECR
jgi:transposase-like protein